MEIMTKKKIFYIFRTCTCHVVYDDNLSREQMNEKKIPSLFSVVKIRNLASAGFYFSKTLKVAKQNGKRETRFGKADETKFTSIKEDAVYVAGTSFSFENTRVSEDAKDR